MNLYQQLEHTYRQLTRRPRPHWLTTITDGDLNDAVTTIRTTQPDSTTSDRTLRALIDTGRRDHDALTVALYALAPKLRTRLTRTVTDDYRTDALTDLTFVLLDSPLDGPRLADRLVNRAHNRSHKAARRAHTHGVINITTVVPSDPERLDWHRDDTQDIASAVADRVDLARFNAAVQTAIADGQLSDTAWAAYCDHRLRRAIDATAPVCSGHTRTTASRTAHKLQPIIDRHLHAA